MSEELYPYYQAELYFIRKLAQEFAQKYPAAAARLRRRDYGRAAFATAVDDGLMPDEVRGILAGRRIVDAFPVRRGESPPAYAGRAVAEMMVAYLAHEAF